MATDYTTSCGSDPLSFMQMLASTIRGYHDLVGVLHYRINALEYPDSCSELTAFLECDTSHIDHERLLVENVFALDDCSELALELFSNSDNDWTNYEECGEIPKTFIELLAHTIVTYAEGDKINAVIETAECEEIEALLDCDVNDIEAERMLVTNLFATDDCGHFLIRLFANASTFTDYQIECTELRQSFYQMLARCIVLYDGYYYLNLASVSGYCEDLHDFWTCSNNHLTPEQALVDNCFAVDSCGNLALKIFNNQGENRQ